MLISIGILMSTGLVRAQNAESLRWLVGTWDQLLGSMSATETWEYSIESGLRGRSVTRKDTVVVFSEKLAIRDSLGGVVYVAVLPDKTAVFTMDSSAVSYARFIDPTNDFPHTLSYHRKDGTMRVTLLGTVNGKPQREVLAFILSNK